MNLVPFTRSFQIKKRQLSIVLRKFRNQIQNSCALLHAGRGPIQKTILCFLSLLILNRKIPTQVNFHIQEKWHIVSLITTPFCRCSHVPVFWNRTPKFICKVLMIFFLMQPQMFHAAKGTAASHHLTSCLSFLNHAMVLRVAWYYYYF